MPLLSSCCCFFDLKVGTKIIGVIKLIGAILTSISIAGLLVLILFLDTSVDVADTVHEANRRNNIEPDDDYVDAHDAQQEIFTMIQKHMEYVKIALYIMVALALLSVVTCSMLIHGVRRDRRGLLIPFIVQEVVNILFIIALDISVAVIFGVPEILLGMVLGIAGGCIVEIYFLLVVISQYQALGLLRMHEEISMK